MPDYNEPHLSDHLNSLRESGDGFKAPTADYLEGLTNRVLAEGKQPAPVRSLSQRWWGAAAAVALLLISGLLWLQPATTAAVAETDSFNYNSEALLADLDAEDINAYISDQLEDFEAELYTSVSENE